MSRGRWLAAAVTATVAAGTVTLVPAAASGGGGPVAASVLGSGSDTTQFMMHALDGLYQFSPGCAQIPTPSGPTAWLDFSCQAPDPAAATQTGTSTAGSSTVSASTTTGVANGQLVTGPGVPTTFPQGVYVAGLVANTSFTLSSSPVSNNPVNADGTAGTGTFTFSNVTMTENYAHDQLSQAYFLGSSNGIHQVCQQGISGVANVSFARSSRAPKIGVSGADCTGLHFVAYAKDGVPWEAFNVAGSGISSFSNATSPCTATSGPCLTLSQLQGIYLTCTITNWNQVGGASVPIDPYTPQSGSGTRASWDTFLGGSSDTCINGRGSTYAATHIIAENNNAPIAANGDQQNAIFPFSFGIWSTQVKGAGSAVLGKINNQAASSKTISAGTFPATRLLYNVYCAAAPGTAGSCAANGVTASQATTNYVGEEGWLCKPSTGVTNSTTLTGHVKDPISGVSYFTEIQNAIKAAGFVPETLGTIGGGDSNKDYCRLFTT